MTKTTQQEQLLQEQQEEVFRNVLDASFDAGFLIWDSSLSLTTTTTTTTSEQQQKATSKGRIIYSNEAGQELLTKCSSLLQEGPPCMEDVFSFHHEEQQQWKKKSWKEMIVNNGGGQWNLCINNNNNSSNNKLSFSGKLSSPILLQGTTGTFWTVFLRPKEEEQKNNDNKNRVLFTLPTELLNDTKHPNTARDTSSSSSSSSSVRAHGKGSSTTSHDSHSPTTPLCNIKKNSTDNNNDNENDDDDGCGAFSTSTVLEQQQKRDENICLAVFECSLNPIFQINEQGTIQMVNHAATTVFGYERDEFLGNNIHMIIGEAEHAKKHNDYIQRYLQTGVAKVIGKNRRLIAKTKQNKLLEIELGVVEVEVDDIFLSSNDIHDDDDTEQQQQQQQERLFCGYVKTLTN